MTQSVALPAVIDTASVAAVRNLILEHRGANLSVNATDVQRIGGLGLQVLLSAANLWAADGRCLTIDSPSAALTEMLRLTGAAHLPEFAS